MSLDYQRLPMDYQSPKDAWRRIGGAVNWMLNNLSLGADTGVITYGATIIDDAGDGTPHGDLNATDFTGHPRAEGDSLRIQSNAVVTFGHKTVAYLWTGPSDVLVGGTQSGKHTAVANDLTPIGTADHSLLVRRDQSDQHPQSAVTSLVSDQQTQDGRLSALEQHPPLRNNPHQVTHDQLVGQNQEPDPHPVYQKKFPGMILFQGADNFTLNTTQSKLVNYPGAAEWNWTDQQDVDPVAGEITVPATGVYALSGWLMGYQGNDNKEEWMEMRLRIVNGGTTDYLAAEREIPTDKTNIRSLQFRVVRLLNANDVLSLWIWGSTGLGTFTVDNTTFEVVKIAEQSDIVP